MRCAIPPVPTTLPYLRCAGLVVYMYKLFFFTPGRRWVGTAQGGQMHQLISNFKSIYAEILATWEYLRYFILCLGSILFPGTKMQRMWAILCSNKETSTDQRFDQEWLQSVLI